MVRFEKRRQPIVEIGIVVGMAAVLVADCLTPVGFAVWVLYLIPLTLALSTWRPWLPLAMASVSSPLVAVAYLLKPSGVLVAHVAISNRVMGLVVLWAVALMGRQFIASKLLVAEQDWIKSGQRDLGARVQGERDVHELGGRVLRFLCEYLEAPVGVLYVRETDGTFRRSAGYALAPEATQESVAPGEGVLGQALADGRVLRLDDLPEDHLPITSALGRARPRHVVAVPMRTDGDTLAVLELGFLHPIGRSDLDLLEATAEPIAVAIRSSQYRARLEQLLDQTRRQAGELQVQQEELRVVNEELEAQSRSLRESQANLEAQQAELEQTNAQLEQQTLVLEEQRSELSDAQVTLVERAEELARANRYKSEFLANMSHELRTPLNSTLILAKLLADNKDGNLTAEQVRYAATIQSSGNDLLSLINDILDLSRVEAGRLDVRPEPVDVPHAVESVTRTLQPLASQKGLALQVRLSPDAPRSVSTDPVRLQQILRNLLSNAVKFTDKGEVFVGVAPAAGGRVAFAVRDTGPGIAPEQQEVIFEAFRQADGSTHRKHGGAGLGLTISRQLARRLGGEITVESVPGQGSTFTLLLPVAFPADAEQPAPTEQPMPAVAPVGPAAAVRPAPSRRGEPVERRVERRAPAIADDRGALEPGARSLLVIEDDPAFAGILRDLARELGFRCLVATSAGEGLRLAEEHLPSAVLLDIELPDGSGLGVLEHLKRNGRTRHIPVHVVSVTDYTSQALEMGAVGYAVKPVQRDQLVRAFEKLEQRIEQGIRRVLVVEDDQVQREGITALLRSKSVEIVPVGTGGEALELLKQSTFDCMVVDLSLPDMSGFDLLDTMAAGEAFSFPPVIVYTGRSLSGEEELRLRRYASSIIVKGARSPERLLDEVTLFLHQIESNLPQEQQRMLREVRNRESLLEGRRILIVEDDVRNVFALSSVLEPKGAKLCIARNGREALSALDRAASEPDGGMDLVLMDIMMPEMDGLTATREIRKRPEWKRLPIIALTAKAMPDDREKCLEAGANDYIAKPLDVEKLLSLVRVWISR